MPTEQSGAAGGVQAGPRPLLADRYALGPVVGTGGMARVHRAEDTLLDRSVAVKVFRLDADPRHAARIQNEIRTLAGVQHPGLVCVYDAGTWLRDDGAQVPFLVMELVEGPTLSECCLDGSLEPAQLRRTGAELAEALAHVHATGVVHRDVKPANILLDETGRAKLTDFGIARVVDSARQTQTGLTVGTAAYLSPEQVQGQPVGPPSDVYSLGLVLLEAATGRREYPGASVETALARLERPPVVPADLPPPLPSLLSRMTAAEPARRPTALQVAAALRGDGSDGAAAPATALLTAPAVRPGRPAPRGSGRSVLAEVAHDAARNRVVLTGLALLLAFLVALVVLLLRSGDGGADVPAAETPAPVSQLEQDLADLREAVTP